jgi:hypothetical protein
MLKKKIVGATKRKAAGDAVTATPEKNYYCQSLCPVHQ